MFVTYVFTHISQQYIKWCKNNEQYRIRMLELSIQWLTLYITDATFDSLAFTKLMWFFQLNDSSIKTPRHLGAWTLCNDNDSNILLMGVSAK